MKKRPERLRTLPPPTEGARLHLTAVKNGIQVDSYGDAAQLFRLLCAARDHVSERLREDGLHVDGLT